MEKHGEIVIDMEHHHFLLSKSTTDWWFGTMEFYDFPYIGKVIIPTDELHHFSEE